MILIRLTVLLPILQESLRMSSVASLDSEIYTISVQTLKRIETQEFCKYQLLMLM